MHAAIVLLIIVALIILIFFGLVVAWRIVQQRNYAPNENQIANITPNNTPVLAMNSNAMNDESRQDSQQTDSNNQTITGPSSSPTTRTSVNVRLRLVSLGASGCSAIGGVTLMLTNQGSTFTTVTGNNGVATFNNVPCGGLAEVVAPEFRNSINNRELRVVRDLNCSSGTIYLGSFSDYGRRIPEREANQCYR